MIRVFESMGRGTVRGFDELGYAVGLLGESLKSLAIGRRVRQPVRLPAILDQMMQIGIEALPIATLLSTTIGVMLSIQSLYSLGLFGAESFAYVGIGLSVTREFAPLIIGILVSGRSGSALAARIATMTINQEVDALRVIGIHPVRYLVAPALVAMVVMVPALTIWSCLVSLAASGLYVSAALDSSLAAYASDILRIVSANDILHGLGKSVIFAVLIALIGVVNGSRVVGGAEGVGRATTRAVVHSISAIIVADMIFAFVVTG